MDPALEPTVGAHSLTHMGNAGTSRRPLENFQLATMSTSAAREMFMANWQVSASVSAALLFLAVFFTAPFGRASCHSIRRLWTSFFGLPLCDMSSESRCIEITQTLLMCFIAAVSYLHSCCWNAYSPFKVADEDLFTRFGKNASGYINVDGTVTLFLTWTKRRQYVALCSAYCLGLLSLYRNLHIASCGLLLTVQAEMFTAVIAAFAFIMAYQGLGGGYAWITAATLLLILRPILFLPNVFKAMTSRHQLLHNMLCHIAMVIVGVGFLIQYFDNGLSKFQEAIKVPKLFIASSMLTTSTIVAVVFELSLECDLICSWVGPLTTLEEVLKSVSRLFKVFFDHALQACFKPLDSIPAPVYHRLEAGDPTADCGSRLFAFWDYILPIIIPLLTLDALTSWTYHLIFIISETCSWHLLSGDRWKYVLFASGIGCLVFLLAFTRWGARCCDTRLRQQGFPYRSEFLFIGLMHWCLCLVRWHWQFKSMHSPSEQLHSWLAKHNFDLSAIQTTVGDDVYEHYAMILDWSCRSCMLSAVPFALAMLFDLQGFRYSGRVCTFAGAAFVLAGVLLPLSENYVEDVDISNVCQPCAKHFDSMVKGVGKSSMGTAVSLFFCLNIFGFLIELPPSLVRSLFLMMSAQGEDAYGGALRRLLILGSLLTPLSTFFPMVSFLQISDSLDTQRVLVLFWTMPSLLVIRPLVAYSDLRFYVMWMISYFGLFLWYCHIQLDKQGASILGIMQHVDMPLFCSQSFANMCFTNVVLSDALYWLLEIIGDQSIDDLYTLPLEQPGNQLA